MCKALLPLHCLPVALRPVAQLRKLPTSLSFENDLKRIFERFSGSFYASPHLAGEHFVCHVGYSLVLLHTFPSPSPTTMMPSYKANIPLIRTCA
jgi:hypothetical protein